MNNNGIYEEGIVALSAAIAKNPNLEVLELSDNAVKRTGGVALGQALKSYVWIAWMLWRPHISLSCVPFPLAARR